MKNVFLDSNIWLSLYHFSNTDLEQFSKLKELNGLSLNLFIPEQTRKEVKRNRDAKIKDAIAQFEKFEFRFPSFCKSYDEYEDFYKTYKNLKTRHKKWCQRIYDDITNQTLPADKVITDLFSDCPIIESTEEVIRAAELRYREGDPPGKDNKLGDAINWECLLNSVPVGEDLYFISSDKDYKSAIDDERFNLFLMDEWEKKKKSKIYFYVDLVSFLKAHVREIELENEQKKEELIDSLHDSFNFVTTHAIISAMRKITDWNTQQIDDICAAAVNNSQVRWIIRDEDILDFYKHLLSNVEIKTQDMQKVKSLIVDEENEEKDAEDYELPFVLD